MDNNSLKLEVSKEFAGSKEELYKAWTEPEQLKQWWQPLGKKLVNVVNEVKPGGEVRYEFDGQGFVISGKYDKAEPYELLEYGWNWKLPAEPVQDADYKLSVSFKGDNDSSTLSVVQYGFKNDESIHPHQQGWDQALEQLNEYISGRDGASSNETVIGKPEMSGYGETPEQEKVAGG